MEGLKMHQLKKKLNMQDILDSTMDINKKIVDLINQKRNKNYQKFFKQMMNSHFNSKRRSDSFRSVKSVSNYKNDTISFRNKSMLESSRSKC